MTGPVSQEDRTLGMLCHLLGLLTGFIAPLILWLVMKDERPFVADQGKEALNWQLTLMIGFAVGAALGFGFICLAPVALLGLAVLDWVYGLIGTFSANRGEWFRYPWSIKFVR